MKGAMSTGSNTVECTDAPDLNGSQTMKEALESSIAVRPGCGRPLEDRIGRLDDTAMHATSVLSVESAASDGTANGVTEEKFWESVIGSRLADYQIESHLGRGSMARVYRARHLGLERPCAEDHGSSPAVPASPPFATSSGPRRGPRPTSTIPTWWPSITLVSIGAITSSRWNTSQVPSASETG